MVSKFIRNKEISIFFIKAYQRQRRISVFFLIKEISVKFFHYFAHLQDDQIFSIRRKKFKLLPHDTCSVTDMGKGGRKVGVASVCVCVRAESVFLDKGKVAS